MRAESERVAWLRRAVQEGRIHTVRVSFNGRLGDWRGKRIPAALFLERLHEPVGFCDGMLVCDVVADIIQETPFSNYGTGYPDLHLFPDLESLREAAWAPGEAYVFGDACDGHHRPLDVSPRRVLGRTLERLAEFGVSARVRASLSGRLMHAPDSPVAIASSGMLTPREALPGVDRALEGLRESGLPVRGVRGGPHEGGFAVELGPDEPGRIAEALVVTKGALKEVCRQEGIHAVFMTFTPGASAPSLLRLVVDVDGIPSAPRAELVGARLRELRGLLQPSITAFKAGPPRDPRIGNRGDGAWTVGDVEASAEADPFTAIAVALAAIAERDPTPGSTAPSDLATAARMLEQAEWAHRWLGPAFVENSAPLLSHEHALFAQAVTDWETRRYWSGA